MANIIHMTAERDGLKLVGAEIRMEDFDAGRRYPAIIVSHGYTGNYSHELPFAERFTALGYIAYTFSFSGGSADDTPAEYLSEGSSTDMSLLSEVADLTSVIERVRSLPYIDPERIVLLGFSQGGAVSGLTAALCPWPVEKLVMVYPALCIPDHARLGILGGGRYDPNDPPEEIACPKMKLGRAFHEEACAMDPYLLLRRYKGPVLILHGLEDAVVDYAYSVKAQNNYAPGQSRLQLIRCMGHGSDEAQTDSLFDSVVEFLEGRDEVFSVRVVITRAEEERLPGQTVHRLYFNGWCDSPLFQGAVLPGGCDTQTVPDGGERTCVADYTLEGLDDAGNCCTIHVVNRMRDGRWKPAVRTDSASLSWMNEADFDAVLEHSPTGPTVRFFVKRR
ncbi:MAG: hypothetical protein E7317_05260 [Clostridiales bacterium]|nr:hypothetical protein [Clostridiales bacterium]